MGHLRKNWFVVMCAFGVGLLCSAMFCVKAHAAPQRVRVDGVLATSAGLPSTGSRDVEIKAYDASTAGTLLWTSAVTQATLTEGRFSIVLDASTGGANSLMNKVSELSSTGELWFEVTIDTGASGNGSIDTAAVVAPRIRSKGVMYALASSRASTTDQIRGTTVDSALAPTSGQVLTYDGTKWIGATVASGGGNYVSKTGDGMSGKLGVTVTGATNAIQVEASSGMGLNAYSNSNTAVYGWSASSVGVYGGSDSDYGVRAYGGSAAAPALDARGAGTSAFFMKTGGSTNAVLITKRLGAGSANLFEAIDDSNLPLFVVGASGAVTANVLTASRLIRTDANKTLTSVTSNPSDAELGDLQGVTAPIQTQLSSLGSPTGFVAITGSTMTGALQVPTGSSETNVGLKIGGATNGLYMDAATLRLVSGGNTQLRLSNTDNAAIFTGALGFINAENTGIFSAAPNMSLRVGGTVILNLSSTQIRSNGSGSVSAPMWTNANDLDTGIFQPGNGSISFTTDGTERLRATSTGVVTFGSVSLSGTGSHLVVNSTDNAASKIAFVDSSRQLISSTAATSQTELAYLAGVTAPIQTQLNSLTNYVESSSAVYNVAAVSTFTHGLGTLPKRFGAQAVVVGATCGFTVGDRIQLSTSDGDGARQATIWANTASVKYYAPADHVFRCPNGTNTAITGTAFQLLLWAEK
jgi:hypothetical protein